MNTRFSYKFVLKNVLQKMFQLQNVSNIKLIKTYHKKVNTFLILNNFSSRKYA